MNVRMLMAGAIMVAASLTSVAQQRCGTTQKYQEQLAKDPSLAQLKASIFQNAKTYSAQHGALKSGSRANLIIPVVVHVMHTGEAVGVGKNISDAQILSQIDVLNED